MNIESLAQNLVLLTDCPHPARHQEICRALADAGIRSVLVVGEDPTPCPMGLARGIWCYVLPLVDPERPNAFERQCIGDFASYERSHGRTVAIWAANDAARPLVCEAAAQTPPTNPRYRILPSRDNSVCCRTYHGDGCDAAMLCHAAPLGAAVGILKDGRIFSKHALTGVLLESLAAKGTWGDPPDYFDYVALARGNCVAPDVVAMSRQFGRDFSPRQADELFYPGVRFFFDARRIFKHPRAAWDGIHPVKIRDHLELHGYLHAVVAPATSPDGAPVALRAVSGSRVNMTYLDHRKHFGLAAWSDAAFRAAMPRR